MPSKPPTTKRIPRWVVAEQLKVEIGLQFWRIPEVERLTRLELLSFLAELTYRVASKTEKHERNTQ